jgi:DNA-binding HxlR family transcriptional regulator
MFSNHVVQYNKAKQSNKKISQTSTDTSPDNILVDWDEQISKWIIKTLQKNSRLGRNVIYNEVNKRYKKARRKRENLSKDVFDKHLKFLLENNIVDKNDAGQRGTKIEHFLTPESIQQLQTGTLNLRELKNQNKKQNRKLVKITPQMKVKALYILILMFNHATSFEFRNEDELISFLAPFRFKLGKLSEVRMADELESEETKKERRHFQTRIESQDKSVAVSIHKYVNPYHGGSTHVYYCQIRGMTKNIVNTNRNDMPFRYISFSPNQVNEAFDFLCKDQILGVVSNSDIQNL